MPLSVNNPITVRDLRGVKDFYDGPIMVGSKAGKIFLLEGAQDSKLVIKDDAVYQPQIKASNLAMKAIQLNSRTKILSPHEVNQLKEFVALYFHLRQEYKLMGIKYRSDMKESMQKLKIKLDDPQTNFHKMNAQQVQDIQKALEKRLNGDKTELQGFTATLAGPNGLESLGRIIAVDLFIGNTDRFFPRNWDPAAEENRTKTIGGQVFRFRALVNPNNVFRSLNGPDPISGLDFLDPQSRFKTLGNRLGDIENDLYPWPMRVLTDQRLTKQFAEDIIHDLELLLNPHKSRLSTKTKLGKNRKNRVIRGMKAGAQLIKQRMLQKYPLVNMTPEVRDRYDVLNAIH